MHHKNINTKKNQYKIRRVNIIKTGVEFCSENDSDNFVAVVILSLIVVVLMINCRCCCWLSLYVHAFIHESKSKLLNKSLRSVSRNAGWEVSESDWSWWSGWDWTWPEFSAKKPLGQAEKAVYTEEALNKNWECENCFYFLQQ
jgi:hypothetical protein